MIRSILAGMGFAAASVLATVFYYEGLHLPFIGQVIGGAISHRLENYVELSERVAAEAKAAREEHDKLAAQQALEEERKRAIAAEQLRDEAHAELEKRIAEDAAAGSADGGCTWSGDDDEWLRHH